MMDTTAFAREMESVYSLATARPCSTR
jgi:hypothetical protein